PQGGRRLRLRRERATQVRLGLGGRRRRQARDQSGPFGLYGEDLVDLPGEREVALALGQLGEADVGGAHAPATAAQEDRSSRMKWATSSTFTSSVARSSSMIASARRSFSPARPARPSRIAMADWVRKRLAPS